MNKIKIVIILLFLIVILGSVKLMLMISEEEKGLKEPITKIELNNQNNFQLKYSYNGSLPTFDQEYDVYSFKNKSLEEVGMAQMVQNLELDKNGKVINTPYGKVISFFSQDKNKELTFSENPNSLRYRNFKEEIGNGIDEKNLTAAAQYFLKQVLLNNKLKLGKPYLSYQKKLGVSNFIQAQNYSEADFVQIDFNLEIDNLPLLNSSYENEAIGLLMNMNGTVKKADMVLPPDNFVSLGKTKLTDSGKALEAINNGQGVISKLDDPNAVYENIEQGEIKNAELTSLELVQVFDQKTSLIQPFYRFSGTATSLSQEKFEIQVLITALPLERFKK